MRCGIGVLALKNFAQLASMVAVAAAPLIGSEDELAGAELEVCGWVDGLAARVLDELELPPHPVMAEPMASSAAADTSPIARKCKGCMGSFCLQMWRREIMRLTRTDMPVTSWR